MILRLKIFTSLIILTTTLVAQNKIDNNTLTSMFEKAFENQSTGPTYLVFTAINKNDSTTKEICAESLTLYFALIMEYPTCLNIDSLGLTFSDSRKIEFLNQNALDKIDFFIYNDKKVNEISDNISFKDFEKLSNGTRRLSKGKKRNIFTKKSYSLFYTNLNEYGIHFIHYLFNNGILTARSCLDGSTYIIKNYNIGT